MIKSKDVNKELKVIDENAVIKKGDIGFTKVILLKSLLKAVGLTVKLIRDIRTNQTRIMEHNKIPLVQDERVKDNKKED